MGVQRPPRATRSSQAPWLAKTQATHQGGAAAQVHVEAAAAYELQKPIVLEEFGLTWKCAHPRKGMPHLLPSCLQDFDWHLLMLMLSQG